MIASSVAAVARHQAGRPGQRTALVDVRTAVLPGKIGGVPGDPYRIDDQPYDPARGAVATGQEGGNIVVELAGNEVVIAADPAGLRDLARWCLALAAAPNGSHIHMDPNQLLATSSESLIIFHSASER